MLHLRHWLRRGPRFWLLALTLAALAASALGPSALLRRDVYHLLFVLDISQSMNTADVARGERRMTRLAAAKQAVRGALAQLPCRSRAGLAVFTEYRSFLLLAPVEVCSSYAELTATLDRMDWRMGWAGASEVAKGLGFAIGIAHAIEPRPALVFISDGHEAPPVRADMSSAQLKSIVERETGSETNAVAGLIVGVGGDVPMPIPKYDMDGKPLGVWEANEVAQTDAFSTGRPGSVAGEGMTGLEAAQRGGSEHLSSLKEAHLQRLASEAGLAYHRLESSAGLLGALQVRAHATRQQVETDLRWVAAAVALAALVAAAAGFNRRT